MYCKKCMPMILATSLIITTVSLSQHSVEPGFSQEQTQTQQLTSEQEKNKALVTEFFNEVFNQRNVSAVDKYYSEDFVSNEPNATDRESHKKAYNCSLITFPDLNATIHDIIAEGDKVAIFSTWNGTYQSKNMPISVEIADLFRISNGTIVEQSGVSDYDYSLNKTITNSTANSNGNAYSPSQQEIMVEQTC
jgi:predicted SnoaL-like aldol condensation-catalyzing enzyme